MPGGSNAWMMNSRPTHPIGDDPCSLRCLLALHIHCDCCAVVTLVCVQRQVLHAREVSLASLPHPLQSMQCILATAPGAISWGCLQKAGLLHTLLGRFSVVEVCNIFMCFGKVLHAPAVSLASLSHTPCRA